MPTGNLKVHHPPETKGRSQEVATETLTTCYPTSNLNMASRFKPSAIGWEKSESEESRISRIILFASHPQRFLFQSNPEAIMKGRSITCACKLAGLPSNENFYSSREWEVLQI